MKSPVTPIVVSASAVAVVALGAVLGLAIVAPERENLGTLITIILTGAGTLITTIVTLGRVEQTRSTTEELSNGRMDAKIRAAIADVLPDDLIKPEVREQLEHDRRRR